VPLPQKPARPGAAGKPASPEEAQRLASREADELDRESKEVEEELEALRARYDQYFLGVERREPSRWRDELKKRVMRLKGAFTRNTSTKFRIQALHARFLSYERLWVRSAREREEGTYRRDLFKARLHREQAERERKREAREAARPAASRPGGAPPPGDEDVDLSDFGAAPSAAPARAAAAAAVSPPAPDAAARAPSPTSPPALRPGAPAAPPPSLAPRASPAAGAANAGAPAAPPARAPGAPTASPPARPPPPAPAPAPAPVAERQLRELYSAFVAAKQRCNEDVSKLTYETVARSVAKQVPELMERYKARSVDFKVVIKDGKAILKAIPKT
jgi:hypothetical protein